MNKLTKVSLTALCGSLATLTAANAGDLSATGAAHMTWTSKSKSETGNPLGMKSNITFSGSGELDGGQAISFNITHNDQDAYSSADMSLTTDSLGTFKLTQGTGGAGIGGYDDKAPTAWEEAWDTGIGSGIDLAKGSGSSTTLGYISPSVAGITLKVAYSPKNDGAQNNDKATSGVTNQALGSGMDVVLDIAPDFGMVQPNLFAGYSVTEQGANKKAAGTNGDADSDKEEAVVGLNLSVGPVKLGGQVTGEYLGKDQTASSVFGYKNIMWGVSFNVNDNLSVSYGEAESKQGQVSSSVNSTVLMEMETFQIAYTMGGASIKIAETEITNAVYSTSSASADRDATTISLALAF
jgi:outer membrane protein OmpU